MNEHQVDEGPKTKDERQAIRHSSRKAVIRHFIILLVIVGLVLLPASAHVVAQSPDDRVERILAAMSVEQRVGQLFMVDFLGAEAKPDSAIAHLIRDYHVGAVYLTWLNGNITNETGTPAQVARLTNSLQQLACDDTRLPDVADCVPLFVAVDHEGDSYPRTHLRQGATQIPSAMAIGATWSEDDAQLVGEVVGHELSAVGVNMLLGPVVDVLERPHPEGGGDLSLRVLGGDPTWVGMLGRAYIRGVHHGSGGRMLTVAKHFPGHGSSDRDPDQEVSTVSKSLDDLKRSDLVPFFAVTAAGPDKGMTDALMPSHIRYRGFQGDVSQLTRPISLDPEGMRAFMSLPQLEVWRRSGLVVADALGVPALQSYYDPTRSTFPARQAAKDALLAGDDLLPIVLYARERDYNGKQLPNMLDTIAYFRDEYRANPLFRQRADDAVRHILSAKLQLYPDLSPQSTQVDVAQASTMVGQRDSAMRGVIQDALTVISPEGGRKLSSSPRSNDDILILGCFRGCLPGDTISETAIQDTIVRLYGPAGSGQIDPAHVHTIQFDTLDALMSKRLSPGDSDEYRKMIADADWIVLGIVAYLPDAIPATGAYKRFLRDPSFDLRNKKLIAVAYSAPYYLDATEIGKLTAYLAVYSKVMPAVEVSVRALFGELPARGLSPVSVPGMNYDLASQLQPDPAQRIVLDVPSSQAWHEGDSLVVRAGPIYDRNGHLMRDGTVVDFSAQYHELGVALAPQVITPTQDGLAAAAFRLTLTGPLDLVAQSGAARSEPVQLVVAPAASPAPTITLPPTLIPTPLPQGSGSSPAPWSGVLIAMVLLLGGAILVRMWLRRNAPVPAPEMDVTARGGPSVEQAPGVTLSPEERVILRQVFGKYSRITIDAEFRSGYSGAHTLLVLPIKPDSRADAYAIAKLAPQWLIRQELANYETFVKDTLPPVTARIEDVPALSAERGDALGALRYTFVGQIGPARTQSLREFACTHSPDQVATVLEHKLFEVFGRNWWMQRRPYSFRLGQEYERLLPVNLVAEAAQGTTRLDLRLVASAREWPDVRALSMGQVVRLEGFTVEEVSANSHTVTLTLPGSAPHRFRARLRSGAHVRLPSVEAGAVMPPVTATIIATRTTLLEIEASKTFLDVHASDETAIVGEWRFPNPLRAYPALLDERIFGTLSTIHGDLNLENILVDPGDNVWLIDFALTRDGHTLYDFARLETELVTRHIAPLMARAGLAAPELTRVLAWLDRGEWSSPPALGQPVLDDAARVLASVRRIVNRCLFDPAHLEEYTRALLVCQLGALKFANLDSVPEAPLPKRLAFVAAAYLAGKVI
jgi:beta-N-acetylhexosaminidase